MKPILCVVDLEESCRKVLEVAASIASKCHTHLIVLFSYRLINLGADGDMSTVKLSMDNQAKNKFKQFNECLLQNTIAYEFKPEIGFSADRISSYAKGNSIGMVIIGENHAYGINEDTPITLRQFITSMNLPFLIIPQETDVEALEY
jgi:hypothetical protein